MSRQVTARLVYGLPFREANFLNEEDKVSLEVGYEINLVELLMCENSDEQEDKLFRCSL